MRVWASLPSDWGISNSYQTPRKAISVFFVPASDLLIEDPVVNQYRIFCWQQRFTFNSTLAHGYVATRRRVASDAVGPPGIYKGRFEPGSCRETRHL